MGLIADYVEANRERASIGDVDPCMIANSSHALRFSYHALHETMRAYSSLNDGGQRDALEKELRRRIVELDRVKTQYILSEKAILEVLNRSQLKSPMMLESLRELCDQIRVAYESVCGVLQELNEHMGSKSQYQAPHVEEKAVRRRLLELLLSGMVGFMNNDATMDTSAFRKVVSDCAALIRILEGEAFRQPDKNVVQSYVARRFSLSKGAVRCPNCGEFLYAEIPYCLNCYANCHERKREHV